jgi:hypothetical protein
MASFSPFIRKTSASLRKALSEHLGLSMPDDVDWADPGLKFANAMTKAIDAISGGSQTEAVAATERLTALADEVGDLAMSSCWPDVSEQPTLAGIQDRAIWLFINHPDNFRRAEEACFIDGRRRSSRFDARVLSEGLEVLRTNESRTSFQNALKGIISDGRVLADIFERNRRGFDGTEYRVVQVTVYAEQRLHTSLEFQQEELKNVSRRPVLSAALTYEPETGTLEVAANTKTIRDALISEFAAHLVDRSTPVMDLGPRRYDLQHLRKPFGFPTDATDRIAEVRLRSLRLMPHGDADQRLTLEVGQVSKKSIWEVAEAQFHERNPLNGGWLITSANLAVTFLPTGAARRGKTISLTITQPNGCDLKDRTELEQMIGNKYLKQWGILVEEPDLIGH